MKYAAPLIALTLLLSACQEELTVAPTEKSPILNDASAIASQPTKLDFGDVEQTLFLEILVPESAIPETWTSEELRTTSHKRLTMMTVDIAGPAPAELPISIQLETKTHFSESPVALRAKVFRQLADAEPEEVYSFKTLIDRHITFRRGTITEPGRFPFQFSFNGREGLTEVPPTLLFYIEAEAVMVEPDTDLDTVDPATVTGGVDSTGMLLSNALRINFDPTAILGDIVPAATPAIPTEAAPTDAPPIEDAPAGDEAPAKAETPAVQ